MKSEHKVVHCELTGSVVSMGDVKVLTKVKGIINTKLLNNITFDYTDKSIHYGDNKSINFFSKIYVPPMLNSKLGELFCIVEDEDDLEQSTALLSSQGRDEFMGKRLIDLMRYLDEYGMIQFPESKFWVTLNGWNELDLTQSNCDNCNEDYVTTGIIYFYKEIKQHTSKHLFLGRQAIVPPPFNLAVSDCSENNPQGHGYFFEVGDNFEKVKLCCNECGVDFSKRRNVVVYYNDFLQGGVLRVLTPNTVTINENLKVRYKYRSIKI